MSEKRKHKSVFLRLVLLGFSVYLVVMLCGLQMELVAKKNELNSYQTKIEEQQHIINECKSILDEGNENKLIERMARIKLGLVFPDEEVYRQGN